MLCQTTVVTSLLVLERFEIIPGGVPSHCARPSSAQLLVYLSYSYPIPVQGGKIFKCFFDMNDVSSKEFNRAVTAGEKVREH